MFRVTLSVLTLSLSLLACDPGLENTPATEAPPTSAEESISEESVAEENAAADNEDALDSACPFYAPVCGEDGLTYASACEAEGVGATIEFFSPCDCMLYMNSKASTSKVQGTWSATDQWRIQVEITGNAIKRTDYLGECGPSSGCPGQGIALSYGTLKIKGNSPIVHVNWTQPTPNPLVVLPILYIYEDGCSDGDDYLVEMLSHELFYAKQP